MTDSASTPRGDFQRNHELLLAEAAAYFTENGVGAPWMEIASRAGVSAPTLYAHFKNKKALLVELYQQAALRITANIPEICADTSTSPLARLERLMMDCATQARLNPVFSLLAPEVNRGLPEARLEAAEVDPIAPLLQEGVSIGQIDPEVTSIDIVVLTNYVINVAVTTASEDATLRSCRLMLRSVQAVGNTPVKLVGELKEEDIHRLFHG